MNGGTATNRAITEPASDLLLRFWRPSRRPAHAATHGLQAPLVAAVADGICSLKQSTRTECLVGLLMRFHRHGGGIPVQASARRFIFTTKFSSTVGNTDTAPGTAVVTSDRIAGLKFGRLVAWRSAIPPSAALADHDLHLHAAPAPADGGGTGNILLSIMASQQDRQRQQSGGERYLVEHAAKLGIPDPGTQ